MKRFGIILIIIAVCVILVVWKFIPFSRDVVSPIGQRIIKPLDVYTIENLGKRSGKPAQIVLDEASATTSAYTVYSFHFITDGKKVTGLAHIPKGDGPFPVVVQLRGYIDKEKYVTGDGSKRSAEVFAINGFLTLAPDFLGYGGSDNPSSDVFEERFQTYTTALDLLASVSSMTFADANRLGMWGHSNGGQIALTVLEILRKPIPTVLWAPVSKPFPYSILYYTDEFSDRGKLLRKRLAEFEAYYDVELYSLPNYIDNISASIQLHQGMADDSVPQKWSDELVGLLKEKEKNVAYYVYPGADHNMLGSWNTVVQRNVSFFKETFQ